MELGLFWVLTEEPPAPQGEAVLDEVERTRLDALRARWEKANASALARLLAVLSNRLFDVYVGFGEAWKVWTELNDKYAESDNGNESFMMASYLNFRMGDSRSVMEQIHELQLIVRDLGQYGCVLLENFQVNSILAKLPTSWRDFVIARRHLKQRLTLNVLITAINVEEKSKAGYGGAKAPAQAHLVEHKNHPGKNVKKEKAKPGSSGPKTNTIKKKKKPEIVYYVCGGLDYKANKCHDHKGKGPTPEQQKVAKAQVHVAVVTADDTGKGDSTSGVQMVDPY
ncbi:uncharacterized protein LOC133927688 [Phragmites australis]|uniref:uncharacterized protein LOC133927688 n=1 Tax=Phragmites australis TaxID=29695 RepID=UPI002D7749FD|nr:uncharacterized protein LOC133927688 [Phragmites australis]